MSRLEDDYSPEEIQQMREAMEQLRESRRESKKRARTAYAEMKRRDPELQRRRHKKGARRRVLPLLLLGLAVALSAAGLWRASGPATRAVTAGDRGLRGAAPPAGPRAIPVAQARAPSMPRLLEGAPPKAVRLIDLLALDDLSGRPDHAPRAPLPRRPPGSTAAGVQAGDLLTFTGWIHRVSRDPDNTYRLLVSPSREAGAPGLSAAVPSPDQAFGAPAMRTQLQTVRAFLKRRLLRQQEPSPRGSVMRHPVFVHLTGQLVDPDTPLGAPPRGKPPRDATARWEVQPVLEVRFALPPGPADDARRE